MLKRSQGIVLSYENKDFLKENITFELLKGPDTCKLQHYVMKDHLYESEEGKLTYPYLSDAETAVHKNYYGRDVVINKFEGLTKPTIGLSSLSGAFLLKNANRDMIDGPNFYWNVPAPVIFTNLNDSVCSFKNLNPKYFNIWTSVQKNKADEIEDITKEYNVSYAEAKAIWESFKPIREFYLNGSENTFELIRDINLFAIENENE